jgi:hypothetical protein
MIKPMRLNRPDMSADTTGAVKRLINSILWHSKTDKQLEDEVFAKKAEEMKDARYEQNMLEKEENLKAELKI